MPDPAIQAPLTFGIGPGALRLLLALFVVLAHVTRWVPFGLTAVYLFFALSGYWMSRIYQQVYAHTRQPLWTYALSRCLRLLPLYLLALLFAIVLWTLCASALDAAARLAQQAHDPALLARNAIVLGLDAWPQRWLVPAWSLDIELQFYIVLPTLLWCRHRWGDRVLLLLVPLSVLAFAWRQAGGPRTHGLEYLWLFLAGLWMHGPATAAAAPPRWSRRSVALGTALAASCALLPPLAWPAPWALALLPGPAAAAGSTVWHDSWNLLLAVLLLPLLAHNVRGPSSPLDRRLGATAYPLYLLHWPLLVVCGGFLDLATSTLEKRAWLLLYIGGSVLLALLVQRLVDQPLERWRQRWVARRRQRSSA